jgi:hypothetical protein
MGVMFFAILLSNVRALGLVHAVDQGSTAPSADGGVSLVKVSPL